MPSLYLADLDAHLSYHDPRLASYRAVPVDLLAYGFSDRPAGLPHTLEAHAGIIAHLLDQIGLQDCHVIGHSMGGASIWSAP